jgi:hypothetical protein
MRLARVVANAAAPEPIRYDSSTEGCIVYAACHIRWPSAGRSGETKGYTMAGKRRTCHNFFGVHVLSELLQVDSEAPLKHVGSEKYAFLWNVLSPVLRFSSEKYLDKGLNVMWCPGENCWWTP